MAAVAGAGGGAGGRGSRSSSLSHSSTSDSGSTSPAPDQPEFHINRGVDGARPPASYNFRQLVEEIEGRENGPTVTQIIAQFPNQRVGRLTQLPFTAAPQQAPPDFDRYQGHGNDLVEDLAYTTARRHRSQIHGIIIIIAQFSNGTGKIYAYHF